MVKLRVPEPVIEPTDFDASHCRNLAQLEYYGFSRVKINILSVYTIPFQLNKTYVRKLKVNFSRFFMR